MVRHGCLIKSLTSFRFYLICDFLQPNLKFIPGSFHFFTDKPKLTISIAIFSELSSLFGLLYPWLIIMLLGEESSRHPLRWCFIAFLLPQESILRRQFSSMKFTLSRWEGLIQLRSFNKLCEQEQFNWALQLRLSGSTDLLNSVPKHESMLIRQD